METRSAPLLPIRERSDGNTINRMCVSEQTGVSVSSRILFREELRKLRLVTACRGGIKSILPGLWSLVSAIVVFRMRIIQGRRLVPPVGTSNSFAAGHFSEEQSDPGVLERLM